MRMVKEKLEELMNVFVLEEETIRIVEKMVMLRLSTKHINLWVRQLDMKRKEICELAEVMGFEEVKKEIEKENSSSVGKESDEPLPEEDEESDI